MERNRPRATCDIFISVYWLYRMSAVNWKTRGNCVWKRLMEQGVKFYSGNRSIRRESILYSNSRIRLNFILTFPICFFVQRIVVFFFENSLCFHVSGQPARRQTIVARGRKRECTRDRNSWTKVVIANCTVTFIYLLISLACTLLSDARRLRAPPDDI